ncbi:MAG: hypothetical protein LBT21_00355 [Oscillospiraceae bacterium]|nr:hypothetical protein [Oscillospiraceae bacterium]
MKRDKPNSAHRGARVATLCVRTAGIILLLLILAAAGIISAGLLSARENPQEAEFLGYRALIADGVDMQPAIRRNALVFIKTNNLTFEKKDIIAYTTAPGSAPVLSRAWRVGETLTVCPDNRSADAAQMVFPSQVLGVVPGNIAMPQLVGSFKTGGWGIVPSDSEKLLGVWNWAAPIVSDVRLQDGGINRMGVAKWGGLFFSAALVFALIWFILERRLRGRKAAAAESAESPEPEDLLSYYEPPELPPERAPTLKQSPDGQPVEVFPAFGGIKSDDAGARSEAPAAAFPEFPDAPMLNTSLRNDSVGMSERAPVPQPAHPPQATFPTLPRTAPPREQAPAMPPTANAEPPAATAQPTFPGIPEYLVATDDEFAAMLLQFEQDF